MILTLAVLLTSISAVSIFVKADLRITGLAPVGGFDTFSSYDLTRMIKAIDEPKDANQVDNRQSKFSIYPQGVNAVNIPAEVDRLLVFGAGGFQTRNFFSSTSRLTTGGIHSSLPDTVIQDCFKDLNGTPVIFNTYDSISFYYQIANHASVSANSVVTFYAYSPVTGANYASAAINLGSRQSGYVTIPISSFTAYTAGVCDSIGVNFSTPDSTGWTITSLYFGDVYLTKGGVNTRINDPSRWTDAEVAQSDQSSYCETTMSTTDAAYVRATGDGKTASMFYRGVVDANSRNDYTTVQMYTIDPWNGQNVQPVFNGVDMTQYDGLMFRYFIDNPNAFIPGVTEFHLSAGNHSAGYFFGAKSVINARGGTVILPKSAFTENERFIYSSFFSTSIPERIVNNAAPLNWANTNQMGLRITDMVPNVKASFYITEIVAYKGVEVAELQAMYTECQTLNEADYFPVLWAPLKTHMDNAKIILDKSVSEIVDNDFAVTTINGLRTAKANLMTGAYDLASLNALYDEFSAYDENDYTFASYAPLATALTGAKTVIDDDLRTPLDIQNAIEAMLIAKNGLIYLVNKEALDELISYAESLDSSQYVASLYNDMITAKDEAKLMTAAGKNTPQSVIDDLLARLQERIDNLFKLYTAMPNAGEIVSANDHENNIIYRSPPSLIQYMHVTDSYWKQCLPDNEYMLYPDFLNDNGYFVTDSNTVPYTDLSERPFVMFNVKAESKIAIRIYALGNLLIPDTTAPRSEYLPSLRFGDDLFKMKPYSGAVRYENAGIIKFSNNITYSYIDMYLNVPANVSYLQFEFATALNDTGHPAVFLKGIHGEGGTNHSEPYETVFFDDITDTGKMSNIGFPGGTRIEQSDSTGEYWYKFASDPSWMTAYTVSDNNYAVWMVPDGSRVTARMFYSHFMDKKWVHGAVPLNPKDWELKNAHLYLVGDGMPQFKVEISKDGKSFIPAPDLQTKVVPNYSYVKDGHYSKGDIGWANNDVLLRIEQLPPEYLYVKVTLPPEYLDYYDGKPSYSWDVGFLNFKAEQRTGEPENGLRSTADGRALADLIYEIEMLDKNLYIKTTYESLFSAKEAAKALFKVGANPTGGEITAMILLLRTKLSGLMKKHAYMPAVADIVSANDKDNNLLFRSPPSLVQYMHVVATDTYWQGFLPLDAYYLNAEYSNNDNGNFLLDKNAVDYTTLTEKPYAIFKVNPETKMALRLLMLPLAWDSDNKKIKDEYMPSIEFGNDLFGMKKYDKEILVDHAGVVKYGGGVQYVYIDLYMTVPQNDRYLKFHFPTAKKTKETPYMLIGGIHGENGVAYKYTHQVLLFDDIEDDTKMHELNFFGGQNFQKAEIEGDYWYKFASDQTYLASHNISDWNYCVWKVPQNTRITAKMFYSHFMDKKYVHGYVAKEADPNKADQAWQYQLARYSLVGDAVPKFTVEISKDGENFIAAKNLQTMVIPSYGYMSPGHFTKGDIGWSNNEVLLRIETLPAGYEFVRITLPEKYPEMYTGVAGQAWDVGFLSFTSEKKLKNPGSGDPVSSETLIVSAVVVALSAICAYGLMIKKSGKKAVLKNI